MLTACTRYPSPSTSRICTKSPRLIPRGDTRLSVITRARSQSTNLPFSIYLTHSAKGVADSMIPSFNSIHPDLIVALASLRWRRMARKRTTYIGIGLVRGSDVRDEWGPYLRLWKEGEQRRGADVPAVATVSPEYLRTEVALPPT